MRAVLDANVIVSAVYTFENPTSVLADILRAGIRGQYVLLTSDHILGEVRLALFKPFFVSRLAPEIVERILGNIERKSERVEVTWPVSDVASHWQDYLVLSTALSGDADFLVTGDRELLELAHPYPFQIINPHEFLNHL